MLRVLLRQSTGRSTVAQTEKRENSGGESAESDSAQSAVISVPSTNTRVLTYLCECTQSPGTAPEGIRGRVIPRVLGSSHVPRRGYTLRKEENAYNLH